MHHAVRKLESDIVKRETRFINKGYLDNRESVRFNFEFCYLLHDSFQQDPQFMVKAIKIELENEKQCCQT